MPMNFDMHQLIHDSDFLNHVASHMKTAQFYDPSAAENILMQPADSGDDMNGLQPSDIIKELEPIVQGNLPNSQIITILDGLKSKASEPETLRKIEQLINAAKFAGTDKPMTKNLDTNEPYLNAQEMAAKWIEALQPLLQQEQAEMQKTSQTVDENLRKDDDEPAKKKDSRGSPFKVLMGEVEKLLNHGMSDSEITKFLLKETNFEKNTIENAVKVVKDYQKRDKKKKASFNMKRYLQAQAKTNTIYEVQPEYVKRSTAELMCRLHYLKALKDYDQHSLASNGSPASSKKGVDADIQKITKALKDRGFEDSEL